MVRTDDARAMHHILATQAAAEHLQVEFALPEDGGRQSRHHMQLPEARELRDQVVGQHLAEQVGRVRASPCTEKGITAMPTRSVAPADAPDHITDRLPSGPTR